jgi:glycosyltransferase involved in cell wall biosynthesis
VHDPLPHPGDRGGRKTPQAVANLAYRRADRVIAHAQHVRRMMVERWGLPPDGIDVVPLAFGWRPLSAADLARQRPRLLFFGRIWPYKGLEHLIAAEPFVSARVPDLEVVIAGGGEDFRRYRRLMAHPERFRVEYGYIPVERREQLFDEAAALVLPYVEATQSGVVPLAYRHGKPVIATTVGGLPEVVHDGRTGRLVPPGDALALAAAIVDVLGDGQRQAVMSAQARQEFETTYDPVRLAAQTLRVYERALERSIRPRRRAGHSTLGLTAVDGPRSTPARHDSRSE